MTTDEKTGGRTTIRVWDLATRLFHWALVGLVVWQFYTTHSKTFGFNAMTYHSYGGYAILSLVIYRLIWGIVGSTPNRFSRFLRGPEATLAHFRATLRGEETPAGHNPVGGLMVVALLGLLLMMGVSGLFANDDIFFKGPWAERVGGKASDAASEIHESLFGLLLLLIAVHVAANLFFQFIRKEGLITAMLTGKRTIAPEKTVPHETLHEKGEPFRFVSPFYALLALAFSAGLVWLVVQAG